jgi:uncharacterized membrane protein YhhN
MLFIRKYILTIFWVLLFLHCAFHFFHLPFVAISKLLLIPSLMMYLFTRRKEEALAGINIFYLIAMLFAFIGDMLLVIINDLLFLPGMIAYMINLVFLSMFFLQVQPLSAKNTRRPFIVLAVLVVVGYLVFNFLSSHLRQFQVPVLCYMFFVAVAAALSVNTTYHPQLRTTGWLFFAGAVIFIISNTILVFNRFYLLWHNLYIAVMLTYGVAQYLFARGMAQVSKHVHT